MSAFVFQWVAYPSIAPTFLVAGLFFVCLVVLPVTMWTNSNRSVIAWSMIYSASIPFAGLCNQLHQTYGGTFDKSFLWISIPIGIIWLIASFWLERRFTSNWIIRQMLIGLVTLCVMRMPLLPLLNVKSPSLTLSMVLAVLWNYESYLVTRQMVEAVCLGMLVWDRTPRSNFPTCKIENLRW